MTCSIEHLMSRLAAAEGRLDLIEDMVDTSRRVVRGASLVVETDTPSPQVLTTSAGGSLELGGEPPMRVVDVFTAGASHTGDTDEAVLHTVTVEANSMGANGHLEIDALFRATGAGTHTHKIKFDGNDVRRSWYAGALQMTDMVSAFVWNKGATDSQETGIMWSVVHFRANETPTTFAVDTTADVDVTFTVQCTDAGGTNYLRFARVKAFYKD